MRKICRTCLQPIKSLSISMKDKIPDQNSPTIQEKLASICELNMELVISPNICENCFKDLTTAYDFKTKCNISEAMILNYTKTSAAPGYPVDLEKMLQNCENITIKEDVDMINGNDANPCAQKSQRGDGDYMFEPADENSQSDSDSPVEIKQELDDSSTNDNETPTNEELPHPIVARVGKKKVQCKVCGKIFSCKSSMSRHLRTYCKKNPKVVKRPRKIRMKKIHTCNQCDFTTHEHYKFVKHQFAHTGHKPYQCGDCQYGSTDKSNLLQHMKTHTGERPHRCSHCIYSSVSSSALRKHMRIHTGEKPFQCDRCGFNASTKLVLQNHMRTHTGEKPYECKLCDYKASRDHHLQRHMRMHTGEKPYVCDRCGYSAKQKIHLQCHLKTHEAETGDSVKRKRQKKIFFGLP